MRYVCIEKMYLAMHKNGGAFNACKRVKLNQEKWNASVLICTKSNNKLWTTKMELCCYFDQSNIIMCTWQMMNLHSISTCHPRNHNGWLRHSLKLYERLHSLATWQHYISFCLFELHTISTPNSVRLQYIFTWVVTNVYQKCLKKKTF